MTGLPVCRKCGTALSSDNWYPSSLKFRDNRCKECVGKSQRDYYKQKKAKWIVQRRATETGRAHQLVVAARTRAKSKGILCTITDEWVEEKIKQGTREATGLSFTLAASDTRCNPFAPSIDQITPGQGYTPENCRVVVWAFNQARGNFSDDVLLTVARAIVQRAQDIDIADAS